MESGSKAGKSQALATGAGVVPDFPGLGRLHVGDSSLLKVNVEAQESEVIHSFQFDGIAEKVAVDECLNCWVGKEMFAVNDEAVVDIPIVCEGEGRVLEKIVVELVPGVFNESDGDVAKGRGELGANPSASDLFVGVVACPENACVECEGHNRCDVGGVIGALCRVTEVVPADVGVVEGVACGFGVDCKCMCIVLALPLLNQRVDGINQTVLGN